STATTGCREFFIACLHIQPKLAYHTVFRGLNACSCSQVPVSTCLILSLLSGWQMTRAALLKGAVVPAIASSAWGYNPPAIASNVPEIPPSGHRPPAGAH